MTGDWPTYRNVLLRVENDPGLGDSGVTSHPGPKADSVEESNVARLSDGQLDCLLLVDQHLSSKEIAVELGISPHTVDQRIRQALQILGVERRQQAARLVGRTKAPYQRLIHQSPHIEDNASAGHSNGAVGFQIRHADRAGETGQSGFAGVELARSRTEQRLEESSSPLPLPFATRSQPRNEMSVGFRLLWIVLIAIGSTFAAGMYLAGLESLARMLGN